MWKTKVMCLALLAVLSLATCCQVGYSAETVLSLDDLPGLYESLVINSDSILTVNDGEAALCTGVLTLQGTEESIPLLEIINNGNFTLKNTVVCNTANLTIYNKGNLTIEDAVFTLNSNATLTINNEGTCTVTDAAFTVYGGYLYLTNTGSLTVNNGYFKDQFDGTYIANYGDAVLSEVTFVANGAYGKFEIFNSGDLQLRHGVFDVNYGGTVNMNSLTGTLTMDGCTMDVSGGSHGEKSEINILGGNSTWDSCLFVNNAGTINYLNTEEVTVTNCTLSMSSVNSSTILSSSGSMFFENCEISGSGSVVITNWDYMALTECNYTSSHSMTLMNNGELTAENWLVKTTSSTARIVVYNGNNGIITFDVPFIEDISSETLTAIGSDGKKFVETSGGTITVTNLGSITDQRSTSGGFDSSLILIIAAAAIVIIIILFIMKKKKKKQDFS